MENFPAAFIIASCDEVYKNNNVLHRLVKPARDSFGVESTDRLVNVVPFRRKYQFRAKHEIDEFIHEILCRPLVLQPILHFGRGLGNCGACYTDESWVVMVNQTHPKILSRLQMGFDVAKNAYEKGQSAELRFHFGKAIQRLYQEHLAMREREEANESILQNCLSACRYSEWEHADLIVRFHGYDAGISRAKYEKQNVDMEWNFEDIVSQEVVWSQVGNQRFPRPHLSPVTEDEIRYMLPAWTVNGVSPLQHVGEQVPELNYSYSKAGRLYESFKKNKKQRNPSPAVNMVPAHGAVDGVASEEDFGAVGGSEDFHAIEHDFGHSVENDRQNVSRSNSRRAYMRDGNSYLPGNQPYAMDDGIGQQDGDYYHEENSALVSSYEDNYYQRERQARNSHYYNSNPPLRRSEVNGHFDADVRIVPSASPRENSYGKEGSLLPYENSLNLKKQDSERSTGSTNADSGYCEDGRRSRGGSYDLNDKVGSSKLKYERYSNERFYDDNADDHTEKGLDNPAFSHHDEVDDSLARHKQIAAAALARSKPEIIMDIGVCRDMSHSEKIAESFI